MIPDYPIAYDAGKALHAAAKAAGEFRYGAQWAGQAAPLARAMPAAGLISRTLGAKWIGLYRNRADSRRGRRPAHYQLL